MKLFYLTMIYTIVSIANADWQTIGDYDVNLTTGEFWNQKLFVGGTLNNDLSIAALKTNETIELINNKINIFTDEPYDPNAVSIYSRRAIDRSELAERICTHFELEVSNWQCHNIKVSMIMTLGFIAKEVSIGNQVMIEGFGRFYLNHYPQRIGRNPKTGVEVMIPATHRVMFRPSKLFSQMASEYAGHIESGNGDVTDNTMPPDAKPETEINPLSLIQKAGGTLMKSATDLGFTASTNLTPPPPVVKVTTTVDQSQGIVSPSTEGYKGSKLTLNALPKAGYVFLGWNHKDCETGIFNVPTTCTPIFKKIPIFQYVVIGEGTIAKYTDGIVPTSGDFVKEGTKIGMWAKPATGWKLKSFLPAPCSAYGFNMPATDLTCTIEFVKI